MINSFDCEPSQPLLAHSSRNRNCIRTPTKKEAVIITIVATIFLIDTGLVVTTGVTNHTDGEITTSALFATIIGTIALHIFLPLVSILFLKYLRSRCGYFIEKDTSQCETDSINQPLMSLEFDPKRYSVKILTVLSILALLIPVGGNIYHTATENKNKTMISHSWLTARVGFRMTTYIVNLIPIGFAFYVALNIYKNIIHKSDHIRYLFLQGDQQMEQGANELRQWSYNIFILNRRRTERNALFYANCWVTGTLICYTIWIATYTWYVLATKHYSRIDLYIKAAGYGLACVLLVTSMWITNNIIDNMKSAIMVHLNYNIIVGDERRNIDSTIQYCEPYALILATKPSIPSILITAFSVAVPFLTTYIKKHLDI